MNETQKVSRVQQAAEAVQKWFLENVLEGLQETRISYAPRNALSDYPSDRYAIFITPEDVSIFDKAHDKAKFTEIVTLTISIVRRLENIEDPTEEMNANMLFLQDIRDKLRFRNGKFPIQFQIVENTTSRPLYDREKLETENAFYSYFLMEVSVNGTRARQV
ncbi:MAG: hypothetical protein IJF17_14235 [Thermoguttaceae bacterium]|nr:hypothetical protein [Thermoguttaceae bacterium]